MARSHPARAPGHSPRLKHERFSLEGEALRIVAVADTHSRPHADLGRHIEALAPNRIVHAGDIGARKVLDDLARHAPVTAVRGNIDELGEPVAGSAGGGTARTPDVVVIDVGGLLKILLTHIAVNGLRLRPDALRLAKAEGAALVVCGHSHVPFATHDRGVTVFNPGSAGPRRFQLPIVFGVIDVTMTGVTVRHIDCETGEAWVPRREE